MGTLRHGQHERGQGCHARVERDSQPQKEAPHNVWQEKDWWKQQLKLHRGLKENSQLGKLLASQHRISWPSVFCS